MKSGFLVLCAAWAALACLAACAPAPFAQPAPSAGQDEAALRALVAAEGQGARTRDVALLESIWAEDGVVRDASHTPHDPADDQVWQGRDAVMLRYETVIFILTLDEVGPLDLDVEVQGDMAVVTGTTRIGGERSPQGERWTFVRRGGEWRIAGITFNLERESD
jgi:ketosteroid isomerase-like protein